jgi:hypothetical protein
MKQFVRQPTTGALLTFALLTTAQARVDTVREYDENTDNMATVAAFHTNHLLGYAGFVADIATAWDTDEGGVIDEFSPSGLNASFSGSSFTTGYGIGGSYDPISKTATGPTITLNVPSNVWDLVTDGPNALPAISLNYFMALTGASIGQNITMATSTSVNVTEIGFTVLATNTDIYTAMAHFSDGTSYNVDFQTNGIGNTFFGAVAPAGEYIDYFSIGNQFGGKIFIDDLAFSTATPVPETSCIGLAFAGLALAARRRRSA